MRFKSLASGNGTLQQKKIRIGTRGSKLALAQAHEVRDLLLAAHGDLDAEMIEIVVISTKGDRILDRALSEIGGKGLFTAEIEAGLEDGSLDIAVHSLKDMPTEMPAGMTLACVLKREDPRDVFISPRAASIDALPEGAVVGTASLRRQAQVLAVRPDLKVVTFRGNVQSRLGKLADGVVDATLLALAGLKRLHMEHEATAILDPAMMLPAVAQGAITIETRADDADMQQRLAPLNHAETEICVTAERALLASLEGSCRTPIAAFAELVGGRLHLRARMLSPDGQQCFEATRDGPPQDAARMGRDAGAEIRGAAGADFYRLIGI